MSALKILAATLLSPPNPLLHRPAVLAPNVTTFSTADAVVGRRSVQRLRKMQLRGEPGPESEPAPRWFPYLDLFRAEDDRGAAVSLSSAEVLELLGPQMMEERKARLRSVVEKRSYSLCLVAEDIDDFGDVSAAYRSADALGVQSVHYISDSRRQYRHNQLVSRGAEKWLDIELWKSPSDCFSALRKRGYQIVTTSMGNNSISIYDVDWSVPSAVVVGNEIEGTSNEALRLSDFHCNIPVLGMIGSVNFSVAASIILHHAVFRRISRLGHHGDLTPKETDILLAEFYLRTRDNCCSVAQEYARRKAREDN